MLDVFLLQSILRGLRMHINCVTSPLSMAQTTNIGQAEPWRTANQDTAGIARTSLFCRSHDITRALVSKSRGLRLMAMTSFQSFEASSLRSSARP